MTAPQHRLLTYLRAHFASHSVAPSYDEMMRALGLRSRNSIHRLVHSLVDQGVLRHRSGTARSIEVVGARLTAPQLDWCERNPDQVQAMMDAERVAA